MMNPRMSEYLSLNRSKICLFYSFCIPGKHSGKGFFYGLPFFLALYQCLFIDSETDFLCKEINFDPVIVLNKCNRPADRGLGSNMPDAWPPCPAGESSIRNPNNPGIPKTHKGRWRRAH